MDLKKLTEGLPTPDPRLLWMSVCIQALMKSHPAPERLRAEFHQIAEQLTANLLAGLRDEPFLQALQALRGGYEAWLPNAPAEDG
jgi:hypothetical protein